MGSSIDREKVLKGLERCKLYNKVNCDKCPYDYNGRGDGKSECTAELASDAIALLKEQEKEIKALRLLVEWATDRDFDIDGMVHVAKRTLEDHGAFEEGR